MAAFLILIFILCICLCIDLLLFKVTAMSRIAEVESAVSDLKASVEKLIAAEGMPADVGLTNAEVDATLTNLKSIKDAVDAALPAAPQA